jgi:hypothetical protein
MPSAPYLWIRDIDPQTYIDVLKLARKRKKSVSETARKLLDRYVKTDNSGFTKKSRVAAARKTKIKVR